ncbi:MAG TPA: transposase [Epulopiscium sp.]|nr:transposase [Candidatus Epulonipiscium sp.]
MSIVDVCLYNYNMYNLSDMSRLVELPNGNARTLYEYLKRIKQEYNVKLAIIGLNNPLRNGIYSVFPNASIIIHPRYVIQMINTYLGCGGSVNKSEAEIAAGIETGIEAGKLTIQEIGCQNMYDHQTKQEAIEYYRQWQGDVPLGIQSFYNVIRTIDDYHEEIFNYFEFKNIFNKNIIR